MEIGVAAETLEAPANTTKRPSELSAGPPSKRLIGEPAASIPASTVRGGQPAGALPPRQVSRRKRCSLPVLSPETKLCAEERNATNRPLPLIAKPANAAPSGALPSGAISTATVCATQLGAPPTQVERTKTLPCAPESIRLVACEKNATKSAAESTR